MFFPDTAASRGLVKSVSKWACFGLLTLRQTRIVKNKGNRDESKKKKTQGYAFIVYEREESMRSEYDRKFSKLNLFSDAQSPDNLPFIAW